MKLMEIWNKHIKGEGKIQNLPRTIDGLFKKNKITYEHLKFLTQRIGMDWRKYAIEDIASYITKIKSDNKKMVMLSDIWV